MKAIEHFTYCHGCKTVFDGMDPKKLQCSECGGGNILVGSLSDCIEEWVKLESLIDDYESEQCGCCDHLQY